jgi:hypothetical protein
VHVTPPAAETVCLTGQAVGGWQYSMMGEYKMVAGCTSFDRPVYCMIPGDGVPLYLFYAVRIKKKKGANLPAGRPLVPTAPVHDVLPHLRPDAPKAVAGVGRWFVSDEDDMRAGSSEGWVRVKSEAMCPEAVTESWQVVDGSRFWLDVPEMRVTPVRASLAHPAMQQAAARAQAQAHEAAVAAVTAAAAAAAAVEVAAAAASVEAAPPADSPAGSAADAQAAETEKEA